MIPDSLECARDKDEIQITGNEFRVRGGTPNQLFAHVTRQSVQFPIPWLKRSRKFAIGFGERSYTISKNRYRRLISWLQQNNLGHGCSAIQSLGSSSDSDRVVPNPF